MIGFREDLGTVCACVCGEGGGEGKENKFHKIENNLHAKKLCFPLTQLLNACKFWSKRRNLDYTFNLHFLLSKE